MECYLYFQIDYVRRPSWQAQLSGTKHWVLKPPPECENQCTGEVQFTINPGDMGESLFLLQFEFVGRSC